MAKLPVTNLSFSDIGIVLGEPLYTELTLLELCTHGSVDKDGLSTTYCPGIDADARLTNLQSNPFEVGKFRDYAYGAQVYNIIVIDISVHSGAGDNIIWLDKENHLSDPGNMHPLYMSYATIKAWVKPTALSVGRYVNSSSPPTGYNSDSEGTLNAFIGSAETVKEHTVHFDGWWNSEGDSYILMNPGNYFVGFDVGTSFIDPSIYSIFNVTEIWSPYEVSTNHYAAPDPSFYGIEVIPYDGCIGSFEVKSGGDTVCLEYESPAYFSLTGSTTGTGNRIQTFEVETNADVFVKGYEVIVETTNGSPDVSTSFWIYQQASPIP